MSEYGYLRQDEDGEHLLIPADEIDEYDKLDQDILESEWMSARWCTLVDKQNRLYRDYRVEGDLYSLRVLLE